MFAYLNILVELGISKKVKIGFLLVGNTHDHIDHMFSHFARTLRRNKFGSLPSLIEIVRKAYHPEPIVQKLEETVDMRRFIFGLHGEVRCTENLMTFTFNINFI